MRKTLCVLLLLTGCMWGQEVSQAAFKSDVPLDEKAILREQNKLLFDQNTLLRQMVAEMALKNPPKKQHNRFVRGVQKALPVFDRAASVASLVSIFGVSR